MFFGEFVKLLILDIIEFLIHAVNIHCCCCSQDLLAAFHLCAVMTGQNCLLDCFLITSIPLVISKHAK